MASAFWCLPRPAAALDAIAADLRNGMTVLVARSPFVDDGWSAALEARCRTDDPAAWLSLAVPQDSCAEAPPRVLHQRFAPVPPGRVQGVESLLEAPPLIGRTIVVRGICLASWPTWASFLTEYAHAARNQGRRWEQLRFLVQLDGELADLQLSDGALATHTLAGLLHRADASVLVEDSLTGLSWGTVPPVVWRTVVAVAVELGGQDVDLGRRLLTLRLPELLDPLRALGEYGRERGWTGDTPARLTLGTRESWDGTERCHSSVLALQNNVGGLRSRIWQAQLAVLFPWIERWRLWFVTEHSRQLHQRGVLDQAGAIGEPEELEIAQLARVLVPRLRDAAQVHLLRRLRRMRNELAHLRPLAASDLASPLPDPP